MRIFARKRQVFSQCGDYARDEMGHVGSGTDSLECTYFFMSDGTF